MTHWTWRALMNGLIQPRTVQLSVITSQWDTARQMGDHRGKGLRACTGLDRHSGPLGSGTLAQSGTLRSAPEASVSPSLDADVPHLWPARLILQNSGGGRAQTLLPAPEHGPLQPHPAQSFPKLTIWTRRKGGRGCHHRVLGSSGRRPGRGAGGVWGVEAGSPAAAAIVPVLQPGFSACGVPAAQRVWGQFWLPAGGGHTLTEWSGQCGRVCQAQRRPEV